jgi:hypothetical protein
MGYYKDGDSVSPDVMLAIPLSIIALAVVLAVIRADRKDLPAIVRALFGRPGDDDDGNGPQALT